MNKKIISKESIQEIKNKISIVEIVEPILNLKKVGNQFRGLSPFTNEKNPSFFICPKRNIFKCYSSGYSGDIIRFVELNESLSFIDAVESLSSRFNIKLLYNNQEKYITSDIKFSSKNELFKIHEYIQEFSNREIFSKNFESERVRYFWSKKRKFKINLIKEWNIGFIPCSKIKYLFSLLKKNFSYDSIISLKLFSIQNQNLKFIFFKRIIIPIHDIYGRIIAFSGRIIPDLFSIDLLKKYKNILPKYINSPNSPIFKKSKSFFGLNKLLKTYSSNIEKFLIVEGPLDVIRCHSIGLKNVISPQGIILSDYQMKIIKRYTSKVNIFFDGDSNEKSKRICIRLIQMALKYEIELKFLILPNGEDPDSFFQRFKKEKAKKKYKKLLKFSKNIIEYILNYNSSTEINQYNRNSYKISSYEEFKKGINFILENVSSPFLIQKYIKEIGKVIGIHQYIIDEEVERILLKKNYYSLSKKEYSKDDRKSSNLNSIECLLLSTILYRKDLSIILKKNIKKNWINTSYFQGKILYLIINFLKDLTNKKKFLIL
jgi:DNA primase